MFAFDQLRCACKCLGVIAQFQNRLYMFVACAIKHAVSLCNYTHVTLCMQVLGLHCSVSGPLIHVPNFDHQACCITAPMLAINQLRCACKHFGVIAQFHLSPKEHALHHPQSMFESKCPKTNCLPPAPQQDNTTYMNQYQKIREEARIESVSKPMQHNNVPPLVNVTNWLPHAQHNHMLTLQAKCRTIKYTPHRRTLADRGEDSYGDLVSNGTYNRRTKSLPVKTHNFRISPYKQFLL